MADAERLIFAQRARDILRRADQPGRAGTAAAKLARRRVEIVVQDITLAG